MIFEIIMNNNESIKNKIILIK